MAGSTASDKTGYRVENITTWIQLGPLGILAAVLAISWILLAKGVVVPGNRVDQVQKVADTFQKAWETERASKSEAIELAQSLMTVSETMQKVLDALPVPDDVRGDHEA